MKKQKVFFDVVRITSAMTQHHIAAFSKLETATKFIKNEIKVDKQKKYKKLSSKFNLVAWGIEDVYGLLEGWIIMKREIL
jgi:hypothetical protein